LSWTFEQADPDLPDVAALSDLHFAEMRRHSPPEACHVLPLDALRDPALTLFGLRDDGGTLLGIGALKQLEPRHGELKSMRTAPGALGRGVGGALLEGLLGEARARGLARVSLETGSTPEFAAALRLYERGGFTPCAPFGGYPPSSFTRFLSRLL